MRVLASPIREITQSVLFSPESEARGIYGNCLQSALASALDLHLDAVPNFALFTWWDAAARLWLRGRSLDWVMKPDIPKGRSIVCGDTERSRKHAVVGEGGQVVWDPHPSHAGLTSVSHAYLLVKWPCPDSESGCILCRRP